MSMPSKLPTPLSSSSRAQARQRKANGQRRARQGKRCRQRKAHAAHADLGNRAGKAHDAHHARHKPDADGEHGGGGKHGKRTLALGDWAGIHTTHALGLVHAREHQPHRYDDRRDNRVRAKVEVRLERGGSSRVDLDPLDLDLRALCSGMFGAWQRRRWRQWAQVRLQRPRARSSAKPRQTKAPPPWCRHRRSHRAWAGTPPRGSRDQVVLEPLRDKEHAVGAALGAVALGERVRKVVRVIADARDQVKPRT